MSYFLYLKQSFRRRPMWHLNIYVIITCALILPLLFSIYLDSSSYGWSQQLISMAKGETFHIANADEKDAEVFRNIEGLSEPYASFIRQGLENAMAAVLIPPVVSTLLVSVTTASTGMGLPFSITLVLTYLICGIMTVLVFVLPVYRQLKKQLKNYR